MTRPLVVAVFGPTGVGKTAVGLVVAQTLGTRIISCDSLQMYRGLPVLTNQPSVSELAAVRHEMVGVAEPQEEWSAARYARAVEPLIEADIGATGVALLVGGTGLYLRAALAPLAAAPPADPELRRELERRAEAEGPEALHRELAAADAEAAAGIHPHNLRRVVRALEVVETARRTGRLQPRWSGRTDLWHPRYRWPTLVFGLSMDRTELHQRINRRTEEMLRGGAVEEVRRLQTAGVRGWSGGGQGHRLPRDRCVPGRGKLLRLMREACRLPRPLRPPPTDRMRKMNDVVIMMPLVAGREIGASIRTGCACPRIGWRKETACSSRNGKGWATTT